MAQLKSLVFYTFYKTINVELGWASLGREFHNLFVIMEKVVSLVSTYLATVVSRTWRRPSDNMPTDM